MSEVAAIPIKSSPLHRISQISEVGKMMITLYEYMYPTSDESMLHGIEPPFVELSTIFIKETSTRYDRYLEDVPSGRTYIST